MRLSFRDLFKPVFHSQGVDVLLHTTQPYIDKMRGFIQADELNTSETEPEAYVLSKPYNQGPSPLDSEQNQLNQSQRHLANAVEALHHALADHKKTSLFGFAWKYINIWPALKHRLFHKNELPDYSKIINRKAVFETLTPFFQEMVLGQLFLVQDCKELSQIRHHTPLIRESVARALGRCTFEQLMNLKDKRKNFFSEIFKETNKIVNDSLRKSDSRQRVSSWSDKNLADVLLSYGQRNGAYFFQAGVNTLETFLSGIKANVFAPHMQGSRIIDTITEKAQKFCESLFQFTLNESKPSPTNAFREIMREEYPNCKLNVKITGFRQKEELVSVPNIIFSNQAVAAVRNLRDARLDKIIDRVRVAMDVEPEVRFAQTL